jgi:uncharacterized membrane protein (DUF106 family)
MNLVESVLYIFYLWIVFKYGKSRVKGSQSNMAMWWVKDEKTVPGMTGALGLLVAYSAALMTVAKTILYCKCSGPTDFGGSFLIDIMM